MHPLGDEIALVRHLAAFLPQRVFPGRQRARNLEPRFENDDHNGGEVGRAKNDVLHPTPAAKPSAMGIVLRSRKMPMNGRSGRRSTIS